MGIEECLKDIRDELEILNRTMQDALNMAKRASEENIKPVEAKKVTIWDNLREWMNGIYERMLYEIISEYSQRAADSKGELSDKEQNEFIHRIATVIRLKKLMDEHLSEDGILKLDEEISQAKESTREAAEQVLEKIKEVNEGKYNKNQPVPGISGELEDSTEGSKNKEEGAHKNGDKE